MLLVINRQKKIKKIRIKNHSSKMTCKLKKMLILITQVLANNKLR